MERLPNGCEGAAILTGTVDFLEQPTIAFIRLAEGIKIPYILEVSVPVRFLFILLGPKWQDINYHEVGRSISTLLSNKNFQKKAYKAKTRRDLMASMNEFLDESLVIPPGKLEKEDLLPFVKMKEKADMIRLRKRRALVEVLNSQCQIALDQDQLKFLSEKYEAGRKPEGPLKKTGSLWGGLVNDVKRRMPMFKSDIIDGLNSDTFAVNI
jgi:Band 3 cytoplasmic domain/HCO3- transporter family